MRFLSLLICLPLFSWANQNYFQQEVNHTMTVELIPNTQSIQVKQEMVYINHAPNTLDSIIVHLWPNAYNPGTDLAKQKLEGGFTGYHFEKKEYYGGIKNLNAGKDSIEAYQGKLDIGVIHLNKPLLSGDTIRFNFDYTVKLPKAEVSRLGQMNGGFQVTQWYIKPAVYDRDGWHPMPYLDQGEFYSEYGAFDITINYPAYYDIAASGNLVNFEQNKTIKTKQFKIDHVHDFAFFAHTEWVHKTSEVILPYSGRKVETHAYFLPTNGGAWQDAVEYIDSAVYYYSLWIGDYPYDVCTAVDGDLMAGAGMEYPTITIVSESSSKALLEEVILHEVGHNWFYGILGSNERDYPWMDEGINSYYERRYYEEIYPNMDLTALIGNEVKLIAKDSIPHHNAYYSLTYDIVESRNTDIPVQSGANDFSELNYGAVVYCKTPLLLNYLEKYLSKPVFDSVMQKYYRDWQFKHPNPKDLQKLFEQETGKDLSWFFEDLIQTTARLDFAINFADLNPQTDQYEIVLTNKGDVKAPVVVSALHQGKVIKTAWYEPFEGKQIFSFPKGIYDEIVVDYYNDIPEVNEQNNRYKLYSLMGKIEPFQHNLLGDFDKAYKTQLFSVPFIGYNQHDNLQIGYAFYNSLLKEKPFRFLAMPAYSFGINQFVGYGQATYSIYPETDFYKINISYKYKRQGLDLYAPDGAISKREVELDFLLRKKRDLSLVKSNFSARLTQANLDFYQNEKRFDFGPSDWTKTYLTFTFNTKNTRKINPYNLNLNAQAFDQNWKLWLDGKFKFTVNEKLQSFDVRVFGGYFAQAFNNGTESFIATANNGQITGDQINFLLRSQDYLMDEIMLGRYVTDNNNLARQQIFESNGFLKTGINLGISQKWMSAFNFTIPTPLKSISLFVDVVTTDGIVGNYETGLYKLPVLYDSGIQLNIIKDYFVIYLPFTPLDADYQKDSYAFTSVELIENMELYETPNGDSAPYLRRIKFKLDLKKLYTIYQ